MTPEKDVEFGTAAEEVNKLSDAQAAAGDKTARQSAADTADAAAQPTSGERADDDSQADAYSEIDEAIVNESDDEAAKPAGECQSTGDQVTDEAEDGEETLATLSEKLAAAVALADEHWQRVLRMQADAENQRKRAQKELANAHKFAVDGIANDLLPVKDSLEMGLLAAQAEEADLAKILEGTELTLKMLGQVVDKQNIVEINPLDEKFDPDFHQAMSMQEAEGRESNTVINVFQKGYTLNERLIRPALVVVAK